MNRASLEEDRTQQLRQIYADLHDFGLALRRTAVDFVEVARGGAFDDRGRRFSFREGDPRHELNRSIDITRRFEFLVAMTGAFSSGKSTLLNLLLGQNDLLPSSVIPLTAVCTILRHGPAPRARVSYVSREQAFERAPVAIGHPLKSEFHRPEHVALALEDPARFVEGRAAEESLVRFCRALVRLDQIRDGDVAFEDRERFIAGGGRAAGQYFRPTPREEQEYLAAGGDPDEWVTREWLALIRDVTLWVPSPLLENDIVFLDLPGLNCREDYHRRAIQEYCNMADCVLVTAFQPGNQADEEVLQNFKNLSNNFRDKIFFAFNKVDQFVPEPGELVRAVDYLARDTVGTDFPTERFFLTSGHLARGHLRSEEGVGAEVDRLASALEGVQSSYPGLDQWVEQLTNPADPGGVGHLQERLYDFLVTDAYPTKLAEVIQSYRSVLEQLVSAAGPVLVEHAQLDPSDVRRHSVLEYFRFVSKLQQNAIYKFRYEYLRADTSGRGLSEDLRVLLEQLHVKIDEEIRQYFEEPILATPLRDDPVAEFDLLRIADEASESLRQRVQSLITKEIHALVRGVFRQHLEETEFEDHVSNLFAAAPDCLRRVELILETFEQTIMHSLKCIVRNGLYYLPRGRSLKRLERPVPLPQLKEQLVTVFTEFYPAWIYENIYAEILDRLWLSLFLDAEDLGDELEQFFESSEGTITGARATEAVRIPRYLDDGSGDLVRTIAVCQSIEELRDRRKQIETHLSMMGGAR